MIKLHEGGIAEMWQDEKSPEMQAISYALKQAVKMVAEKVEKTKCFSDIDKLDEKTLDYFAVEQRAMYYSQALPIERKRAIIKNTLNWYTKAGTPAAVAEMVDVIIGGGKVVEWFDFDEPPYTPGTFDIVTSALMTADIMEQLVGLVQKVKNVRSHVRRVIIEREVNSGMNACIWMFSVQDSIVPNVLIGDYGVENGVYAVGYIPDVSENTTVLDYVRADSNAQQNSATIALYGAVEETNTTVLDHVKTDSNVQQNSTTIALYGEVEETSTTVK